MRSDGQNFLIDQIVNIGGNKFHDLLSQLFRFFPLITLNLSKILNCVLVHLQGNYRNICIFVHFHTFVVFMFISGLLVKVVIDSISWLFFITYVSYDLKLKEYCYVMALHETVACFFFNDHFMLCLLCQNWFTDQFLYQYYI